MKRLELPMSAIETIEVTRVGEYSSPQPSLVIVFRNREDVSQLILRILRDEYIHETEMGRKMKI
jgi:hypothetical protein